MKKNIGILIYGIEDVSGGGGSERFWADFFEKYKNYSARNFEVFFFCDEPSFLKLKFINRLSDKYHVVFLKNYNNRFKHGLEFFDFYFKLLRNRIKLIHVAEYTTVYFHRLKKLSSLPKSIRPRISTTVVNCIIPYKYMVDASFRKPIDQILTQIKFDGILSWYQLLKNFIIERGFSYKMPIIHAASYCFADTSKFKPATRKENNIVFAARLGANKNPLLFVEAITILHSKVPEKIKEWNFYIYGKGELEVLVKRKINEYGLSELVKMAYESHMAEVFSKSKCFVSTQDYENFTSLSMLEAMACGNVIVSRNVGQTNYFARSNVNAFLAEEDTANGIANALLKFINNPELHDSMMRESIKIATLEHTKENFFHETETYWKEILLN